MNLLTKSWRTFLDILFPSVCLSCRRHEGDASEVICKNCFDAIRFNRIYSELSGTLILGAAASYDDVAVRNLIHALKYENLPSAAKPLAELIIKHVEYSALRKLIEPEKSVIVPVPLHPARLRARGYNQSELIAGRLGTYFNIPVATSILKRVRNTSPQIEMKSRDARAENLRGSFSLNPNHELTAATIILVDDVYTSGSTIKEAAKALRALKLEKIIVLVAARAGY